MHTQYISNSADIFSRNLDSLLSQHFMMNANELEIALRVPGPLLPVDLNWWATVTLHFAVPKICEVGDIVLRFIL